jgi:hypothetical protein
MRQPAAAKAVLLEVVNVLGAFREDLVIRPKTSSSPRPALGERGRG